MKFRENWAQRLFAESEGFKKIAYLPRSLPAYAEVLAMITAMFPRFRVTELPRVRAWVDGGQRYTITDKLVQLAQEPDLDVESRLAQACESEQFCVTFNGLSAWSQEFAQMMQQEMLRSLFQAMNGVPHAGCDFYAFIGNYGFTPFGVHDDLDHSLLWHLGPGVKHAYLWPRAEYTRLTGGVMASTSYQDLLPHAIKVCLHPGDLLFIPMGDFHILDTPAFSVMMGLTLFPENPIQECSEGLRLLTADRTSITEYGQQTFTLDALRQLRKAALQSNGWISSMPMQSLTPAIAYDALEQANISTYPDWPMIALQFGAREALAVRQRIIWTRTQGLLAELAQALHAEQRTPVSKLLQQFKGKLQEQALFSLLLRIHQLGGILIEKD
ncbi:hypothetical protein V8J88_13775 [Massilia sp. W12]|uniref:hypothetical protein n=1 Tax=Massilia sp. W12 TaxID=3126507 RepID=UPI0030CCF286